MSSLRVTSLRGRTAGSAPTLPDGAVVTGVVTATTLSGNVSGGSISGTTGTFTGNVSIAGTLTYDDVTRIDSVGIVTAGGGLFVGRNEGTGTGIAVTITTDGNADFGKTGIVTASSFEGSGAKLTGLPAGWNWVDGSLF